MHTSNSLSLYSPLSGSYATMQMPKIRIRHHVQTMQYNEKSMLAASLSTPLFNDALA